MNFEPNLFLIWGIILTPAIILGGICYFYPKVGPKIFLGFLFALLGYLMLQYDGDNIGHYLIFLPIPGIFLIWWIVKGNRFYSSIVLIVIHLIIIGGIHFQNFKKDIHERTYSPFVENMKSIQQMKKDAFLAHIDATSSKDTKDISEMNLSELKQYGEQITQYEHTIPEELLESAKTSCVQFGEEQCVGDIDYLLNNTELLLKDQDHINLYGVVNKYESLYRGQKKDPFMYYLFLSLYIIGAYALKNKKRSKSQ